MMKKADLYLPWIFLIGVVCVALWLLLPSQPSGQNEPSTQEGITKLKVVQAYSPFKPKAEVSAIAGVNKLKPPEKVSEQVGEQINEPVDEATLDEDALASFVASVTVDDPRAPPIGKSAPYQGAPEEVLADPQLYSEYEADKRRSALKQFVLAAQSKVTELEQLIEQGKARGISQEQLQEGLRKLAALKRGVTVVEQDLAY